MYSTFKSGLIQTKAYRVLRTRVNAVLSAKELSMAEWAILGNLFEKKQLRFNELADLLAVEAPLVTSLVDNLEKNRLVKRKNDKTDRRAKLVFLTEKALTLIPEVEKKLKTDMNKVLQGVSSEELLNYFKVLETIILNEKN